jgi:hypothetical protein
VTLLSGLVGTEEDHVARCETLARQLQPFRIIPTEPSHEDTYFQCVFLLVQRTSPLLGANALARSIFRHPQGPYLPHVSLLYGHWPEARRRTIIDLLPSDIRTSFDVASVRLIKAFSDDPKDWHEIGAFPMAG